MHLDHDQEDSNGEEDPQVFPFNGISALKIIPRGQMDLLNGLQIQFGKFLQGGFRLQKSSIFSTASSRDTPSESAT